jgi:hypothetical protein
MVDFDRGGDGHDPILLKPTLRRAPTEQIPFEFSQQDDFDEDHDEKEQEGVRQHLAHIEHLIIEFDFVADPVAAPEQFDERPMSVRTDASSTMWLTA